MRTFIFVPEKKSDGNCHGIRLVFSAPSLSLSLSNTHIQFPPHHDDYSFSLSIDRESPPPVHRVRKARTKKIPAYVVNVKRRSPQTVEMLNKVLSEVSLSCTLLHCTHHLCVCVSYFVHWLSCLLIFLFLPPQQKKTIQGTRQELLTLLNFGSALPVHADSHQDVYTCKLLISITFFFIPIAQQRPATGTGRSNAPSSSRINRTSSRMKRQTKSSDGNAVRPATSMGASLIRLGLSASPHRLCSTLLLRRNENYDDSDCHVWIFLL